MTSNITDYNEDHSRTIIHIDLDCFYAQVEMVKNPSLRSVPIGIQQKNIVVTSNYLARDFGVKKCMLVTAALKVCPNLVLINGENLYDYRKASYKVTDLLKQYSPLVERLGLDENYIDITELINLRLCEPNDYQVEGHLFNESTETCGCDCQRRLIIGSHIAQDIRDHIHKECKLTSSAGIAHNKLLAKLIGALHKPNQQTTIFPNSALAFMFSLKKLSDIPGIGNTMTDVLTGLNIKTIKDLQESSYESLKYALSQDKAKWLHDVSYGRDNSQVKPTGKPHSIGLEDSCKIVNLEIEIKEKFHQLLNRLIILVREDGRIPTTIKVTVRKYNNAAKVSHRETRQCNINSNIFISQTGHLNPQSEKKLLNLIMHLFKKLVNTSQSFHITLLGLSFTKFQERVGEKNSIVSYFVKNLVVQSITSIENKQFSPEVERDLPTTSQTNPNAIDALNEVEPSSKKKKLNLLIDKNNSFGDSDYLSPSKLKVADLHLDSTDEQSQSPLTFGTEAKISCPPDVDAEVFKELPKEVQRELCEDWRYKRSNEAIVNKPSKKAKTNTLYNYFIQN